VSAIHKRKNLANMLRAFDKFKENGDSDVKFVVAGERFGSQDDVEEVLRTMHHAADVRFLGHVTSEELAELMASAHALMYASLFEGFGIPILEAFAAETAVITSNVTSMPEVAGEAAILVDPQSVEQMADAMQKLWADESFRQSLIAKGREQRARFSWEQTADWLWQCVEKALQ
jgi:glycosyltransferase involved in cell wall biosynthesis